MKHLIVVVTRVPPPPPGSGPAESERRADIQRLRRRFLKDQEKVSLGFALKEVQHQRQRKVLLDTRFTVCLCVLFAYL